MRGDSMAEINWNLIKQEYINSKGAMLLKDLAAKYGIKDSTVRSRKNREKWDDELNDVATQQRNVANKNRSSKIMNHERNRSGNHNPKNQFAKRNKEAETHGFFSKIFPAEVLNIVEDIVIKDPLDILWENIIIQYTAIARAQKIMYVTNKEEMIKELKKEKHFSTEDMDSSEIEYDFQFAWDRQATFLNAQSRAMTSLQNMIKNYDELLHKNWEVATEEQKLRIQKLKVEIEKINQDSLDDDIEYIVEGGTDEEKEED